ncbi:hypothetical protein BJ912DRAFT_861513 [Pholiota molesta]|nr:hypothetical protein BJ912DRAFT_861513 [Pholiota molesta]
MISPHHSAIPVVLRVLEDNTLKLEDLLITILTDPAYKDHPTTVSIKKAATNILHAFQEAEGIHDVVVEWADKITIQEKYQPQMLRLAQKESGFWFSATTMTEEALTTFDIEELASRMQDLAPDVWKLFGILLSADVVNNHRRQARALHRVTKMTKGNAAQQGKDLGDGDIDMGDLHSQEFIDEPAFEQVDVNLVAEDDDEPEDLPDQLNQQESVLITIKRVICISIMMQSTNRYCNTLQSVMGIFLHSCNAPETITDLLARIGLSIASSTVNLAVTNLSKEAYVGMQRLGQGLLVSYAFDNLDIDLKHSVPTVEKPQDTLIHITSGTMLPLYHGITQADLDCSDFLWQRFYRNPNIKPEDVPNISFYDLLNIHPKPPPHPTGLTRRERFNAWKYRSDLVQFGPEYFRTFLKDLGDPEAIDEIPILKTSQTPLRAVDVSPSTPAGNVEALKSFFQQTKIGDPLDSGEDIQSVGNSVVLLFGDLLTGQHIRSVLESRSSEATPWRRMQFGVFVMGLFHLKMACVDALWRIFINHKKSDVDETSLMSHIGQIRPKETGRILTKPGFRRMHEVVQHVGIVTRLDLWRIEAERRNHAHKTLEDLGKSKPTWETIVQMSYDIVKKDSEAGKYVNHQRTQNTDKERDQQYENTVLQGKYFLLYEEMSHAMNHGDIGRVEDLFVPWIFIFLGCGKHKYATEMRRSLENIHFIYPAGLKRAIRMNILCNPTGKKGHFRAIDWVVEHNNLYTKVDQCIRKQLR